MSGISSGAINMLGAVGNPYRLIITIGASLLVLKDLVKSLDTPISADEGLVMWVLHCLHYHQDPKISGPLTFHNILAQCKQAAAHYQCRVLDTFHLAKALGALTRIGAVKEQGDFWVPVEIIRIG